MSFEAKLITVQSQLQEACLDGWLLYDFRKTNDLACAFLEIPSQRMLSRRLFYWIPKAGTSIKIVHQIEPHALNHLPGEMLTYSSWQELHECLKKALTGSRTVAMEYSHLNAIPYVSKVDAGTVELVQSFGPKVVSSADLLQGFTSIWTPQQLQSHQEAANILELAVAKAWQLISTALGNNKTLTEWDVQNCITEEFGRHGCMSDYPPMCAVNAHSADPHFELDKSSASEIKPGDFILIDLWCKKKSNDAVYADITRVGVAAKSPTKRQQEIFDVVKSGRDAAMALINKRLASGKSLLGWEVDNACREAIAATGNGKYFTHRTGHNLGEKVHGAGANIDNFETKEMRKLLPGTCFTIEPGVYLPGEFGVRLEHDVYIEPDGKHARITNELQHEIVCLI